MIEQQQNHTPLIAACTSFGASHASPNSTLHAVHRAPQQRHPGHRRKGNALNALKMQQHPLRTMTIMTADTGESGPRTHVTPVAATAAVGAHKVMIGSFPQVPWTAAVTAEGEGSCCCCGGGRYLAIVY
mmetsp:Transcript_6560/g.17577  ORF Transcript_6560/g.17577 Transcript_6560/m.17577 type:complete len:129 (-) Transcript_6560:2358-2744(-)|eukprot:1158495-Pelagomonas_calceolata.AAC.4